jgi:hypothetical protein
MSNPAENVGQQDPPIHTNHGNQEVSLNFQSIEHLGSMLDIDPATYEPGYKYRWVYKTPMKISRAKGKGYRLVDPQTHRPKIANAVGDSPDVAEDGTYTVGDVVLMRTPLGPYRARRKIIKARERDRIKGPKRQFKKKAKSASRRLGKRVRVITDEE